MYRVKHVMKPIKNHIAYQTPLLSDATAPLSEADIDQEQDELLKPLLFMLESDQNVYLVNQICNKINKLYCLPNLPHYQMQPNYC